MTEGLKYRPATAEDIPAIVDLRMEAYRALHLDKYAGCDRDFVETVFGRLLAGGEFVGVVESDGKIVGAMVGGMIPVWWEPKSRIFQQLMLWVSPKFRRMGGSRLLLDAAESWCAERGITALLLATDGVHMSKISGAMFTRRGYTRANVYYGKVLPCQQADS